MQDTIAAIATPPGRGGVGIVRISGEHVIAIVKQILTNIPKPRVANFTNFLAANGEVIDSGLALYFPNPHSFTGEDVLELHAHGGPVVMDLLLQRVLQCGARLARPGEFSERAFLNDKIDLAQAEAIADLIDAASVQAALSASRSLQGEFSKYIHELVEQLIALRLYVEAAIDFPEEEIDFLSDGKVTVDLKILQEKLNTVLQTATQGVLLKEGITVVLAGKPNVGKSSLLNRLSGRNSAIVTNIAGTTRDVLREIIQIDGLPLHIIDTAGLRDSDNIIEKEGIRRTWFEVEKADVILFIADSRHKDQLLTEEYKELKKLNKPLLVVWNKIDLLESPFLIEKNNSEQIPISAKTGIGIDQLKKQLKKQVGFHDQGEHSFIARRRHVEALLRANNFVRQATLQFSQHCAGELLAEDLLQAQKALSEITGEFTSDDLLGKIFSSFCIGK